MRRTPQGGDDRDWPNERLALLADGATDEDVRIAEGFGLSLRTMIGLRARLITPRDPLGMAVERRDGAADPNRRLRRRAA